MKLFQHKTLGGAISITTAARYPADNLVAAGFEVVATFGNSPAGQLAYEMFRTGLSVGGRLADNSLFDEDAGQFLAGDLAELIAPAQPRSRNFVHGVSKLSGEPVWARNIDGCISWSTEAPTMEQDVMDGSMSDENRTIYDEIKSESEATIRDISSINTSGGDITKAPVHPALR